jgi:RNA polymerase sigma-70 factor (ECF subfamily)
MKHDFNKLWEEFSGRVRSFVYTRVANHSSVDDIVQEVFIKIHRNMDKLTESSKVSSWIFTIARNTIIDYYREKSDLASSIDDNIPANDDKCDSPECEIAAGLYDMVLALPEKYSQAMLLTEFDGLSQQEASSKLGISVSGVKSRVQRARNMIRDSLLRCCHFTFDRYGTIVDPQPAVCCCCLQESIK